MLISILCFITALLLLISAKLSKDKMDKMQLANEVDKSELKKVSTSYNLFLIAGMLFISSGVVYFVIQS